MSTIYEDMHAVTPKIENLKREYILERYAHNYGVKEKDSTKYFSMLWEAFAWAAIIGFYHDKKKPLKGDTDKPFRYSNIYNQGSDIYYALILFAIAKEGYNILKDHKLVNKVIEEYANGGFEIIFSILEERGPDYFGDEANFLQEIIERGDMKYEESKSSKRTKYKKVEKINTGQDFDIDL